MAQLESSGNNPEEDGAYLMTDLNTVVPRKSN
jgi:hypothetical protein